MVEKRFKQVYYQKSFLGNERIAVIKDTVTGVHYLKNGYGDKGGLTPLLDENGKVIIEK